MRVGQDVMGTMAATLILAVFGGSLGTWVLDYVYDLPFLQLLNSNSLDIVIMQGLSGGIGVILTVPIAAGCSAFLLAHKRALSARRAHPRLDEPDIFHLFLTRHNKRRARPERSPSFLTYSELTRVGSARKLAVLRYLDDTGLAALIVGDFIDLVCPDLRDVLDFCLRVHRLHDFCSNLLADFRRALQHEQATPYA